MVRSAAFAIALTWPFILHADDLPVPSDGALEGPLGVIRDIYGQEHANAKTDKQLRSLAKKLLSVALTTEKPVERYAMLRVARDIATQGHDALTAFQIIDQMDRTFQLDPVRMKASVLYSLTKRTLLAADRKALAEQALSLADLAIARDDFELSDKLVEMALDQANKARDMDLVRRLSARQNEIERFSDAFADVTSAAEKLKEDPTDPDANLAVGRYRCFVKGDWKNGIPMLALGSDTRLKALAAKELGEVTKSAEQVELGDSWWELAEDEDGTRQALARQRAVFWFQKALPELTGLTRARVKRRLEEPIASVSKPRSIPVRIPRGRFQCVFDKSVYECNVKRDRLNRILVNPRYASPVQPIPDMFDEHFYLQVNPDVASVVRARIMPSALHHYNKDGKHEGRLPSKPPEVSGEISRAEDGTLSVRLSDGRFEIWAVDRKSGKITIEHWLSEGDAHNDRPPVATGYGYAR